MTPTGKLGLALAGGALVAGAAAVQYGGGAVPLDASVAVTLTASPREIDEGDLVEFAATVEASGDGGAFVSYEWDFGDGSRRASGAELATMRHRFVDNGSPRVTVRVNGGAEATVPIRVRNVAPMIQSVGSSRPALAGDRVTFDAVATDPGLRDRLTYTWDFGDGSTGTGQTVRHAFDEDGHYDVTVTVDDGDGGEDQATLSVIVGEGFRFTTGGAATGQQEGWIWVSTLSPRDADPNSGLCRVSINFELEQRGLAGLVGLPRFGLRIAAHGGLREGRYPVAFDSSFGYSGQQVLVDNPDLFFAGLQARLSAPDPGVAAAFSGFAFYSRGGTVSIDHLDRNRIEGTFQVEVWVPAPLDGWIDTGKMEYRDATVTGVFAGTLAPDPSRRIRINRPWEDVYNCQSDEETFDIDTRLPAAHAVNVETQNPEMRLTFTRPVNPETIAGRVRLEYGVSDSGGARLSSPTRPLEFRAVPGTWEAVPGDDRSIRFVPQAHLPDGVIHCVRVRTGHEGVRGRRGEVLMPAPPEWQAPSAGAGPTLAMTTDRAVQAGMACHGDRDALWPGAREWAFATLVEVESVALRVSQASLVPPATAGSAPSVFLVSGKPTVARVYSHWYTKEAAAEGGVNAWSQVRDFPARVSVELAGTPITAPRRTSVRRPDLFDAEDRRHARNTVNLFGWRPSGRAGTLGGRAVLQAMVEPTDAAGNPVRRFESAAQPLAIWHDAPVLSVDYYYLQVNGCAAPGGRVCEDWTEGVPATARGAGHALLAEGSVFTTQNFPVIETQARAMGDLPIDAPLQVAAMGPCEDLGEAYREFWCYNPGVPRMEQSVNHYVGGQLYEAGRESYADVLVGIVPPGFASHWAGVMVRWSTPTKRLILAELDRLNIVGLAHEFGHFFDLPHCPASAASATQDAAGELCRTPIVGFRMNPSGRGGFNKHHEEGNQEAADLVPLMHYRQHAAPRTFIQAIDYARLFDAIANAPRRQGRVAPPLDLRQPWPALARLFVRPVFAQAGNGGTVSVRGTVTGAAVALHRVQHRVDLSASEPPTAGGDLTLDLLDAAGGVLRSVPFAAATPDRSHDDEAAPAGPASFALDVPAPVGLHAVRVTAPGGVQADRARSAGAPVLRADVTPASATAPRTLRWTTTDPDGDDVRVDVYLRADHEDTWRGAVTDTPRTSLSFAAHQIPPGRQVTARLVASDGFNTTTTDVNLGPGAAIGVLATTPADGAEAVPVSGDISVYLSAPLRTARPGTAVAVPMEAERLRLTDPDDEEIFADVVYLPRASTLIVTPVAPLRPGTRYTATLAAGLEDPWGGRLAEAVSWSFVTAEAPAVAEPPPAVGDAARRAE